MMRVALPGGRLWNHSLHMLDALEVTDPDAERCYVFHRPAGDLEVLALKIPDIPAAIDEGFVDVAVASDEWLAEHGGRYRSLIPLCWYHVRICLLTPEPHMPDLDIRGPCPWTVATPYPRLSARLLDPDRFRIRPVAGAVEAYPGRLTDLAIDCVETGATAASNGLSIARELLCSDVRLVASPRADLANDVVQKVIARMSMLAWDPECRFGTPHCMARPR